MSNPIGIYLHIPFCISKCPYCDFYSRPTVSRTHSSMSAPCCTRWTPLPERDERWTAIYFGGGTPVLLGGALLEILQGVYRNFSVQPDCEVTLEANPAAMTLQTPAAAARGRIQSHLDGGAVGIGPGVANFGAAAQL